MNLQAPAELETLEAVTLEAIYTFTEGPQKMARLPFIGIHSEADALHAVLSHLSEAERQSLLKISLCLYCPDPQANDWLWLDLSRGKYYFTAATPEPARIDPALVDAFKRNPSNESAQAIYEAAEAAGIEIPRRAELRDSFMAGMEISNTDTDEMVCHIAADGRLNACEQIARDISEGYRYRTAAEVSA